MPGAIAGYIHPRRHEPDFTGHVVWAQHIHPDKPCRVIDKMRAEKERLLDLVIHIIGHDKSAQNANGLLLQLDNSSKMKFFSKVYAYTTIKREISPLPSTTCERAQAPNPVVPGLPVGGSGFSRPV